jgi:hypothetical protein
MATQTTSTAAWKIRTPPAKTTWDDPALLNNLHLSTSIPKPSPSSIPANAVLVRIRAAAINARDLMVVAHDDRISPLIPPSPSHLSNKIHNHQPTPNSSLQTLTLFRVHQKQHPQPNPLRRRRRRNLCRRRKQHLESR